MQLDEEFLSLHPSCTVYVRCVPTARILNKARQLGQKIGQNQTGNGNDQTDPTLEQTVQNSLLQYVEPLDSRNRKVFNSTSHLGLEGQSVHDNRVQMYDDNKKHQQYWQLTTVHAK